MATGGGIKTVSRLCFCIFLAVFFVVGVVDYWVIVTSKPVTAPLAIVTSLGQTFTNPRFLGAIVAVFLIGTAWYLFCQKAYSQVTYRVELPADGDLDDQIRAAQANLASAKTGSEADNVFLVGIFVVLSALIAYMVLVYIGAGPAQNFIGMIG